MDFLRQLSVFVSVVESGSFSRASEKLRMARPGVTNAINELEAAVGMRLLHRTTRRTSLTGEGEAFYARATALLNEVAQTQHMFGGSAQRPRGRLRVDIPVALAKPLVISELPRFHAEYPDVEVILGVSDQPVDLVADAVDCVLRIGALPASSMIARKLATITMIICGAPAYLEAHGKPRSRNELAGHVAINYFSGRGHRPLPWDFGDSEQAIVMPSAIMVNDSEAFVGCALEGMGLIQVPQILVERELADGRLVRALEEEAEVQWPLSIMYPNRQYLAPQVRLFIEWIAGVVAARRGPGLTPARVSASP